MTGNFGTIRQSNARTITGSKSGLLSTVQLRRILRCGDKIEDSIDIIVVDLTVTADIAIVPVTPDSFDAWAIGGSLEMLEGAQQFNESLSIRLILTKLRAGTTEANVAREMFEELGYPILRSEIGFRVAYGRFADAGQGVVDYEPSGKAAKEIKQLADELENMKLPAIKEVANV